MIDAVRNVLFKYNKTCKPLVRYNYCVFISSWTGSELLYSPNTWHELFINCKRKEVHGEIKHNIVIKFNLTGNCESLEVSPPKW